MDAAPYQTSPPALTAPFILACLLCIGGERLYLRLAGSLGARLGRRRS
ncbi:hypothetical protein [Pseudomonas aeruginosa]|nr:hypothetical protein [Pseudomonas aeruginosa]